MFQIENTEMTKSLFLSHKHLDGLLNPGDIFGV